MKNLVETRVPGVFLKKRSASIRPHKFRLEIKHSLPFCRCILEETRLSFCSGSWHFDSLILSWVIVSLYRRSCWVIFFLFIVCCSDYPKTPICAFPKPGVIRSRAKLWRKAMKRSVSPRFPCFSSRVKRCGSHLTGEICSLYPDPERSQKSPTKKGGGS